MAWFRTSREGLRYSGGIEYRPFAEWSASAVGVEVLGALGAAIRFAPLGRIRTARRRLWRELTAAARRRDVSAALQAEAGRYLALMAEIAYAEGLPRVAVELQRLVVVPRCLLNGVMLTAVEQRLLRYDLFPTLPGRSPIYEFFCAQLVHELDRAVLAWRATPRRTLPTSQHWASVGHDEAFAWTVSLTGEPVWCGHHYLFEVPARGIGRRIRREIESQVREVEQSLPSLTRDARQEILRRAWTPFLSHAA